MVWRTEERSLIWSSFLHDEENFQTIGCYFFQATLEIKVIWRKRSGIFEVEIIYTWWGEGFFSKCWGFINFRYPRNQRSDEEGKHFWCGDHLYMTSKRYQLHMGWRVNNGKHAPHPHCPPHIYPTTQHRHSIKSVKTAALNLELALRDIREKKLRINMWQRYNYCCSLSKGRKAQAEGRRNRKEGKNKVG